MRHLLKSPVAVAELTKPETVWAVLAFRRRERERLEHAASESDVDQVGLVQVDQQTQMIAQLSVAGVLAHDASGNAHHIEADFLQCPSHQPVHFITPPAAPPTHDLVEAWLEIERYGTAQLHVEILERDGVL